jgi:PAS domain S-box-containing protein
MVRANKVRFKTEKRSHELAAIVTSSDEAIVSSDLAGIVVAWNKGAQDLYGYTAEEMIGQPIAAVVPEHAHEESLQILRDIAGGQSPARHETVRKRKGGSLAHVSLIVAPARNPEGRIIGYSTIAHDITERRRREVCEYLAAVVESSDDAIIGRSLDGTITAWNPGGDAVAAGTGE